MAADDPCGTLMLHVDRLLPFKAAGDPSGKVARHGFFKRSRLLSLYQSEQAHHQPKGKEQAPGQAKVCPSLLGNCQGFRLIVPVDGAASMSSQLEGAAARNAWLPMLCSIAQASSRDDQHGLHRHDAGALVFAVRHLDGKALHIAGRVDVGQLKGPAMLQPAGLAIVEMQGEDSPSARKTWQLGQGRARRPISTPDRTRLCRWVLSDLHGLAASIRQDWHNQCV